MRDLRYMTQGEIAHMQQSCQARKYYYGYLGWIPPILAMIGTILIFIPHLSTIANVMVALSAVLGLAFLQKPVSDDATTLLKSLGKERPSPLESIIFPVKYELKMSRREYMINKILSELEQVINRLHDKKFTHTVGMKKFSLWYQNPNWYGNSIYPNNPHEEPNCKPSTFREMCDCIDLSGLTPESAQIFLDAAKKQLDEERRRAR